MPLQDIETFAESLRRNIRGYEGEHVHIVAYAPIFWDFYLRLLDDVRFSPDLRRYVNAAIAYVVMPANVIPEEEVGPAGYLDDVYLCAHVARNLIEETERRVVLEEAWDHDEPLEGIVEEVLEYCEDHLDADTRRRILKYVGLE